MNEVVCYSQLSYYSSMYNHIFIFLEGLRYKYNRAGFNDGSENYYSIYLNDRFITLDDEEFDRYFTSIADFRNKNINKVLSELPNGN